MKNTDLKQTIQNTLKTFDGQSLSKAASALFKSLGYYSDKRMALTPNTATQFQVEYDPHNQLNSAKAMLNEWKSVDFLFQITDEEIRGAMQGQAGLFASQKVDGTDINSYLFFAVSLKGKDYSRSQLATAAREINKRFLMPVMVLFHYDELLTMAIIARRLHKRDPGKDILEKVTLIKEISTKNPHRAHIEILHDLSISQLAATHPFTNFVELQHAWEKMLDTSELNKKFYKEVANWYFWAVKTVKFPTPIPRLPPNSKGNLGEGASEAQNVIRLITRLIFVWFIKEKGLVPEELFDQHKLKELLNYNDPQKSTYYKAILQNLFFATLNTEMGKDRMFRRDNAKGQDPDYLMSNFYRYKRYFKKPDTALELFARIPFLNGGLFECLDKEIEKGIIIRVDGFSDRDDNPLSVPDDLFLMEKEKEIDLNEIYDTTNKKYKVRGLIHIFNSYKFTIEENTPVEEEIALDPELLGKVFENLLAAYNPETGTTARKQTGSFYTPREIVNYMVDEALIAYFEGKLERVPNLQARLCDLLAYNNEPDQFTEDEEQSLISAIDSIKVLDPACGSGAFPMGILHKLVFVLNKLDPQNEHWKERQAAKASEIVDSVVREAALESVEEVFRQNFDDYGRKLYLIENCIYGVDIQPIAVQIAKLRFFISLVVDQKTNLSKVNLGIRPLPNLETKFVAANTLIGINRPDNKPVDEKPVSIPPDVEAACDLLIAKLVQYLKSRNDNLRAQYIREAQEFADVINAGMGADFKPLAVDLVFTTAKDTVALKALLPVKPEAKASTLVLRNQEIEEKEKELERVRREHFSARTLATKRKYRDLDKKLRFEVVELLKKNQELEDITATQLAGWDPYNQNAYAEFFDPEWMFGVEGGFDVVIGNPPYIGESGNKEIFRLVAKGTLGNFYQGKMDYLYFFFHLALNVTKENAICALVTTNYFITATGAKKLRNDFKHRATIRNLLNFNELKVFESALGQHNMITIISKGNNTSFIAQNCITQRKGLANTEILLDIVKRVDCQTSYSNVSQTDLYDGKDLNIRLFGINNTNDPIQNILQKIQNGNILLEEYCFINQGIVTGANYLTAKNKDKYNISNLEIGSGIFLVTNNEVRKLNLPSKEKNIIKPIFKNSDISKYYTNIENEINLINIKYTDRLDLDDYPKIKTHLIPYKKLLLDRPRTGTLESAFGNGYWYVMTTSRRLDFESPKIVVPYRSPRNTFGYNEIPWYGLTDIYFITQRNSELQLKYILSLLNSKLYFIWLYNKGKRKGEILELFYEPLSEIPIKKISPEDQRPFIRLADQILAAKRADPQADTRALEAEIDQLVYSLYGLTEEEIKIVEGKGK